MLRISAIALAMAALAACASTPSSPSFGTGGLSSLRLCPGVQISNAPPTDSAGQILNFDSTANIGGAALLRAPVEACVSSGFGPRNGGASSFHHGVDLYTRSPAPVYAGGDGVVQSVDILNGYGKTVVIRHARGLETRYAHLSSFAPGLRPGVRIRMGERIGLTGRTGNATAVHLHYEIIVNGKRHNPLTVGG